MQFMHDPAAIEARSMALIEELVKDLAFGPEEKAIVKRVIHASGDPEYGELVSFHPESVARGLAALQRGAPIFTDVQMVAAGINKKAAGRLGCTVHCAIGEDAVAGLARREGITRAMAAFRRWGQGLQDSLVVIGNAPTALFEVLRLHREEGITPALVVGVPVGFVGAAEAKEALRQSSLPYITVVGRKGGSPIAASIVNSLLYLLQPER
ncbi:MAG TPA: precorrin-8X methylmutase [Clostridia bacterium]|nr:precorrin-8X methylmutase [Clostridia bacterium]